jgi:hypothetical protein
MRPTNFAKRCRGIRHPDRDLNAGAAKIEASLPHETETKKEREIAGIRDFELPRGVWRLLRKCGFNRKNQ